MINYLNRNHTYIVSGINQILGKGAIRINEKTLYRAHIYDMFSIIKEYKYIGFDRASIS